MPVHTVLRRLAATPAAPRLPARIAGLLVIATGLAMGAGPAVAGAAPLVGSDQVQSLVDSSSAGLAKAFRYSAPASGTVNELNVYVDASSTATSVDVGLYSNVKDRPATRLATCKAIAPRPGWNACAVPGASVTAGTRYWLAILAPVGTGGRVAFRDRPRDGVVSYASSSATLTSLPATFAVGTRRGGYSPASIYGATATASVDATAPSVPTGLTRTGSGETSVSLSWTASTDANGVSGYRVYRDGMLAGGTSATTSVVPGLTCGTSYAFAVEAYDATGNTSARTSLTAATAGCPAPDVQAPSVPQGMAWAGTTNSSIALAWNASSDDTGVAGYRLYRNGQAVGTTTGLSYTVSGLSCGTSHTIGLEAFDAAGNASNRAEATGTMSTQACADVEPSPSPSPSPTATPSPSPVGGTTANLWVDTSGGSCSRSGSRAGYSDGAACGSIDAANDQCRNGDLVLIKGGSYASGTQNVSGSAGRSSMCQIEVLAGERALMKRLSISDVRWLTLRGMESLEMDCSNGGFSCNDNSFIPDSKRALYVSDGSEDVVIENVKYGGFGIFDSRRVTIRGSDFGPCDNFDGQDPGAGGQEGCPNGPIQYCEVAELGCTGYNEGHLIENNRIHDFGCDDSFFNGVGSDDCHWESMYVSYAKDLTIRGNVFSNAANGGNIFNTFSNGGGTFSADFGFVNYTVENNVFEQSCNNSSAPCGGRLDGASGFGHCNIYGGGPDLTNVKIRFNTFIGGSTFNLDIPCTQAAGNGLQIVGNLMKRTSATCGIGWTPELATYNIYSGSGTCGTNSTNVGADLNNLIVSDVNGGNAHLRGAAGTTSADNYVPRTVRGGCPATDIDGQPRSATGPCDAGADER